MNSMVGKFLTYCKTCCAIVGVCVFSKIKRFRVIGPLETINFILLEKVSVSRYGDGEMYVMMGRGNGFQKPDEKLSCRLKEILNIRLANHISCMPYPFEYRNHLTKDAYGFWRGFIGLHFWKLLRLIPSGVYYDTNFTRFYMDFKDKSGCTELISKICELWKGRDVYIVEGRGTRMGVGNDLLSGASNVYRILGPSSNAFDKYDDIINAVMHYVPKNALILCALGMTATVLAYDLHKLGYWVIDIGHIDIEYEWYRKSENHKVAIDNKSVNELEANVDSDFFDQTYISQIICRIE